MIDRQIEGYVKKLMTVFPVVSLLGPRQSGKTTLAKKVFPTFGYVTLEDPLLRREALADGRAFLERFPAPLIIDEVQYVPSLLSFIQVKVDQTPNTYGQYVLTGSHQPALRAGLVQSLAGRVGICQVYPLSLVELMAAGFTPESPEAVVYRGLMPRLYNNITSIMDPRDFYPNYVATYLERDVNQLLQVKKRHQFDIFLHLLATRVGQILNVASLAKDVSVSAGTIKEWLSILEASFIITLLPSYQKNYGKRFIKSPKLFFVDTGILCHLLGISDDAALQQTPLMGHLFENLVVLEAIKARQGLGLPTNFYFIRDSNGLEVDLVSERSGHLSLFEIKLTTIPTNSLGASLRKLRALIPDVERTGVIYSGPTSEHESLPFINYIETARLMTDA